MSNPKFFRPEAIERRASELLAKHLAKTGAALVAPVLVDRLVEDLLDLQILWDKLPEKENSTILAGLAPKKRLVVFNEAHVTLFDKTPGLYRTVLAHEVGHWDLHVDKATLHQTAISGIDEQLQFLFRSEQQSWDESNAHLFMSYLLVPDELLTPLLRNVQHFDWPALYKLRDLFQVTISVIRIRLEKKGILFVDPHGQIRRSRAEYEGQARML